MKHARPNLKVHNPSEWHNGLTKLCSMDIEQSDYIDPHLQAAFLVAEKITQLKAKEVLCSYLKIQFPKEQSLMQRMIFFDLIICHPQNKC